MLSMLSYWAELWICIVSCKVVHKNILRTGSLNIWLVDRRHSLFLFLKAVRFGALGLPLFIIKILELLLFPIWNFIFYCLYAVIKDLERILDLLLPVLNFCVDLIVKVLPHFHQFLFYFRNLVLLKIKFCVDCMSYLDEGLCYDLLHRNRFD